MKDKRSERFRLTRDMIMNTTTVPPRLSLVTSVVVIHRNLGRECQAGRII